MRGAVTFAGQCAVLLALLASLACGARNPASEERPLTPGRAAAVEEAVRSFTRVVAHDVSQEGPLAWQRHFADGPAFFMAADGRLVFPSGAAAHTGIQELARSLKHIDLQWGDDLRVDPLTANLAVVASSFKEVMANAAGQRLEDSGFFTATAEFRDGHWQFRNAHWSSAVPPPHVP